MNRRALLIGSAGLAAGVAGIGAAWHAGHHERAPEGLWSLALPRIGGGTLAFDAFRGKPLLVNFWATWCVPCVVEMPLLQRFHASHATSGWQIVGIAVDQELAVAKFVSGHTIRYPIVLAGLNGLEVSRELGNSAGGLPFSVAVGRDGTVLGRRLGAVDDALLALWASVAH